MDATNWRCNLAVLKAGFSNRRRRSRAGVSYKCENCERQESLRKAGLDRNPGDRLANNVTAGKAWAISSRAIAGASRFTGVQNL